MTSQRISVTRDDSVLSAAITEGGVCGEWSKFQKQIQLNGSNSISGSLRVLELFDVVPFVYSLDVGEFQAYSLTLS